MLTEKTVNDNKQKLKEIIATIDTVGWDIIESELIEEREVWGTKNDMFPISQDESNYYRGKIEGINIVLRLIEGYKKEYKETPKK